MKRKTMGWLIVFLLFIVYMLNYMDRSALSITAPLIEKELGFNAAEMGMIFSAFFRLPVMLCSHVDLFWAYVWQAQRYVLPFPVLLALLVAQLRSCQFHSSCSI